MPAVRGRASGSSLFPLPLAPLELLMLLDDQASHPMTCGAEFTFRGHFDRALLESSLERALTRHPLFSATVERGPYGRLQWVPAAIPPRITWLDSDEDCTDRELCAYLNLFMEPGLRIRVREFGGDCRIHFEFHHACSDGAGGLGFVEDLLAGYASAMDPGAATTRELPPVNLEKLRDRGRFAGIDGWSLKRLLQELYDLPEVVRFLRQTPLGLATRSGAPWRVVGQSGEPRLVSTSLDTATLSHLRSQAAVKGASLNELLIQALFRTLWTWNQGRGGGDAPGWFRIMMPWNLRTRADLECPATNRLSFAFLSLHSSELRTSGELLQSIVSKIAHLRSSSYPLRVLSKFGILSAFPFILPWVRSRKIHLATAVLSNVGDPTRRFRARLGRRQGYLSLGNVTLIGFQGSSPIRRGTDLSLFVNTYAQQLNLAVQLDRQRFQQLEAEFFLEAFAQTLTQGTQSSLCLRAA